MNIRTKLLTIAALLAVWSCTEKDPTPVGPDGSDPIEFGSVSTKALITGINQVNEFGVSCAISNSDNSDYGSIMNNVKVFRDEESATGWNYNPKSYWLEDSHYYFVAAYPFVEGGGFELEDEEINGVNIISYNLNVDTYDEHNRDHIGEDILAASEYVNTLDSWNNTVNFKLHHLLTNVNFEISQDMDSDPNNHYFITGISLYGISTNGTYTTIAGDDSWISYWTLETPVNDVSYDKAFDEYLLEEGDLSVWGEDGLLLLPQNIAREKVTLRIDYLYELDMTEDDQGNQNGDNQEPVKQQRSETINLPATDQWKSGNKIKYRLSFAKPTKIVFTDISVKPWGSAQPGGTIIIK